MNSINWQRTQSCACLLSMLSSKCVTCGTRDSCILSAERTLFGVGVGVRISIRIGFRSVQLAAHAILLHFERTSCLGFRIAVSGSGFAALDLA